MRKLILITLSFIFLSTPSDASETDTKIFTNEDLHKYRRPYDRTSSSEGKKAEDKSQSAGSQSESKPETEEPIKHVISYEVSEGTEMSIIIPVTINNDITDNMLLDTGASGMHISLDLAIRLGVFDSREAKLIDMVMGVGGPVPVIVTIIDSIRIGDMEYRFIPTTISDTKFYKFNGLIGMDFMTNYSVHIDNRRHEVVFEELPETSEMPAGRSETWWRVTFRNFRIMTERWKQYRDKLYEEDGYYTGLKELQEAADRQYERAKALLTRLDVYASVHAVPLQWR